MKEEYVIDIAGWWKGVRKHFSFQERKERREQKKLEKQGWIPAETEEARRRERVISTWLQQMKKVDDRVRDIRYKKDKDRVAKENGICPKCGKQRVSNRCVGLDRSGKKVWVNHCDTCGNEWDVATMSRKTKQDYSLDVRYNFPEIINIWLSHLKFSDLNCTTAKEWAQKEIAQTLFGQYNCPVEVLEYVCAREHRESYEDLWTIPDDFDYVYHRWKYPDYVREFIELVQEEIKALNLEFPETNDDYDAE